MRVGFSLVTVSLLIYGATLRLTFTGDALLLAGFLVVWFSLEKQLDELIKDHASTAERR